MITGWHMIHKIYTVESYKVIIMTVSGRCSFVIIIFSSFFLPPIK